MKISVIIPVYNTGEKLYECLDSVVHQTGIDIKDFEIIIIDDGSKAETAGICDRAVKKYSDIDIKVYHQDNKGVSEARNAGIAKAGGKYITFVDADDTIDNDAFHYMLYGFTNDEIKMVSMADKSGIVTGYDYVRCYLLYGDTHVWGKLYKTEFLKEHSFQKGLTIGEDMLFLLDLACDIGDEKAIVVLDKQKYRYFDNAEGAMKKAFKISYLDQIECWDKAEEKIKDLRREKGVFTDEQIYTRLAVIKTMAIMLVAGKLAIVSGSKMSAFQREDFDKAVEKTTNSLKKVLSIKGTFKRLDMGYKVKVLIYRISPNIYFRLYGSWKNGR
ncbi:MAG: glycosyltransferase family 2 protein [Butyrivibrio sp.]|nr:glycosyltransferase family 2 protein [Butyrivibrio sp.]